MLRPRRDDPLLDGEAISAPIRQLRRKSIRYTQSRSENSGKTVNSADKEPGHAGWPPNITTPHAWANGRTGRGR